MKKGILVVSFVLFLIWGLSFAGQKEKVAIAVDENVPGASVSERPGLGVFFLIFDDKANLVDVIDNPFQEKEGTAGYLMADFLADKEVTVVVGEDFCDDIVPVIKAKGITPIKFKGSVEGAASQISEGLE
jgi:predicted Fe-Mo cluster-binding NifX family protein